ncbi:MAG: AtpZ/AtpI family protein [Planctomycetota bacterium]
MRSDQSQDPVRQERYARGRTLGLVVGIGPMFAAGIVLGYFGGRWVDTKLGSEPFGLLAGVLLGSAAGFREVVRVLSVLREDQEFRAQAKRLSRQKAVRDAEKLESESFEEQSEQGKAS